MDARTDRRLRDYLQPAAVLASLIAILLRWWTSAQAAGPGTNLLIHAAILAAALIAFADAVLRKSWTFRYSGAALPLILLALLGVFSVTRASHKLPALECAVAYGTFAVLYVLTIQLFTTRRHLLLTLLFAFVLAVSIYALFQRFVELPELQRTIRDDPGYTTEFKARLLSNEVWGSFAYPNTLAGFLALTLPMLAGFIVDSGRRRAAIAPAGALLVGVAAIALTGSKGGWLACGVGTGMLAVLLATRGRPKLRRAFWVFAAAAIVGIPALAVAGPLSPRRLPSESMRIRDIYWTAAVKIARDHPVFGVGLDNFREYFPAYKGEAQQEVKKVHNDYLQVLVDLGIVGLLAFLGFLGWTLGHGVRAKGEAIPPPEPIPGERRHLISAGIAAVVLWRLLVGDFSNFPTILAILAGWTAYAAWTHPATAEVAKGDLEGTRLGILAGICAFAVHLGVDYDFYDFGVAMSLILAAALLTILSGRVESVDADRSPAWIAVAFLLLLILPALYFLPRLLDAERKKSEGMKFMADAVASDAMEKALVREGRLDEARRASSDAAGLFTRALESFQEWEKRNVLDVEAHLRHAELRQTLWDRLRRVTKYADREILELQTHEQIALQAVQNALTVCPRSVSARGMLGAFHLRLAQFYEEAAEKRPDRQSLFRSQAVSHRTSAGEHDLRAIELYPTLAPLRYQTARAGDEGAPVGDARLHYAEALRFSDLAARERQERLQLNEFQKARALLRLERKDEALRLLRSLFASSLTPNPKQRRLTIESLLGHGGDQIREIAGDEYDAFMKPVIDGVLRDMLSEIP